MGGQLKILKQFWIIESILLTTLKIFDDTVIWFCRVLIGVSNGRPFGIGLLSKHFSASDALFHIPVIQLRVMNATTLQLATEFSL